MTSDSNTPKNTRRHGGLPFTKGDTRINRKGRPKNFDALRALVLEVGNEVISSKDGSVQTTRIQGIVRDWLTSNNFQKQKAILEIAYGKVPDKVEVSGADGAPVVVQVIRGASFDDV
jgi:hypothetical protein